MPIHSSAKPFRICCQPILRPNINARHLSSASAASVANSNIHVIETSEPWPDSSGKALSTREEDDKGIIIDDLPAALAARPASKKAATIRKIKIEFPGSKVGSLLGKGSHRGSKFKKTHDSKDEPDQMWPAYSIQAKKLYGKTGSRGLVGKDDPFEYTGVAQWPSPPWKINQSHKDMQMQRPWLAFLEPTNEDHLKRLTNEIKAFEVYMRLSPQEEAASQLVISDVASLGQSWGKVKEFSLLGSRRTGLAAPTSDFDFTFASKDSKPSPSEANISQAKPANKDKKLKIVQALKKMSSRFHSSEKFRNTDLIQYARVPIIRSTHIATGLDVQIQTMTGYRASEDYCVAYLSELPSLRPLYFVLRYCLEARALTTVFEGGLGSYSILMMIVTALKHANGKFASVDLAGQLLHVLEFYGKADLYKVGFSAEPQQIFEKQRKERSLEERITRTPDPQLSGIDMMKTFHPRKPYLLCLQDPANKVNDLGKNAYAIKHIQATFNTARERILAASEEPNNNLDDKSRAWSCLDSLVRADYRQFEKRRNKIARSTSRGQRIDLDYSNQRIDKEFEKQVKRYKGVAEDEKIPERALEVIAGNAAEGH